MSTLFCLVPIQKRLYLNLLCVLVIVWLTDRLQNQKQRWLLACKETNQTTQEVKNKLFLIIMDDETKREFSANFAFDETTNGQIDIKHEIW